MGIKKLFWTNAGTAAKPNIPERVLFSMIVLVTSCYLIFMISSNRSIGYAGKVKHEQFIDTGRTIPSLSSKDKETIFKIIEDALAGYNKVDYGSMALDSASNIVVVTFTIDGQPLGHAVKRDINIAIGVKSAVFEIAEQGKMAGVDYKAVDICVDILGDFIYQKRRDLPEMNRTFKRGVNGVWANNDKGAYAVIIPAWTSDPNKQLTDYLRTACHNMKIGIDEWKSDKIGVYFFKSLTIHKRAYSNLIE